MDQYITLVSNASMDLFPDNRLSSFRTRLPYVHDFSQGNWALALTEITYTKSWFNIDETHYMSAHYVDDGEPVELLPSKTKILPGYYTPTQLVDHINTLIDMWPTSGLIKKLPKYGIKSNMKLTVSRQGSRQFTPSKGIFVSRNFACRFDPKLNELLGIADSRPIYLDQGMNSLYVYCDLIQKQVVGDTFEPLLRTVGVNSESEFGENVTEIFENPYYLPLSQTVFQEVQIDIRNDMGQAPPFNFGRVTVILHIVPQ